MRLYDEKDIYNSLRPRVTNAELDDIMLPLKPVQAIPLDKIKEAREEIQKLRGCSCSCSDGIIDDVEDILDKLAESEVVND